MKVTVNRKAQFNAAHRLINKNWSDEENRAFFGKCFSPNYHGHNYSVIVGVTGTVDPETGYVIDMKVLKELIRTHVEEPFDHRNLNLDTQEFEELNPTAENMAVVIWKKLRLGIDAELELKVTVYETERNFVEFDGNGL